MTPYLFARLFILSSGFFNINLPTKKINKVFLNNKIKNLVILLKL